MNILNYQWDFREVWPYIPSLLSGLWTTLAMTALAIVIGTPLGILAGMALRTHIPPLRYALVLLVDAIRALPILILILWIYYFVPVLLGQPRMNPFSLAVLALTINLAAFVADITRAAVNAFPQGLLDAAYACGLSKVAAYRYIVVPDVVREILPSLSLLYIDILKLSSLASVIAVYELVHTADRIRSVTFQAIEVFTVVGLIYLLVVMPLSAGARRLERSNRFRRRSP